MNSTAVDSHPSAGGRDILRQQATQEQEEKALAVRALLMNPLLTPNRDTHRESLRLVRRHAAELTTWFKREAGWQLRVEREYARLHKVPGDPADPTRGWGDPSDPTRGWEQFNRRRYAIFCMICAVLERSDAQITLRILGESVLSLANDFHFFGRGFNLDMQDIQDRRDLASACKKLGALGILSAVDGDAEDYVQGGGTDDKARDALYDVHRGPLSNLLIALRGPSTWAPGDAPKTTAERITAVIEEFHPDTDEGRRDAIRHHISRRLLDDPVVYNEAIADEDKPYFINQRGAIANRLASGTGLKVELRAEGLALCDPDGSCSDIAMPADGTNAHVTLLVADHLTQAEGDIPSRTEIERFVAASTERYGRYWRRNAKTESGVRDLTASALARLAQLKLITVDAEKIEILPALFRYKLGELDIRHRNDTDDDLFGENAE
ncbi:MAG: TIGR02678 family protein [Xanthobacteraceae bacterium]|nr:TIGR02678 family protein [Xanthobacteraceae bacterium]